MKKVLATIAVCGALVSGFSSPASAASILGIGENQIYFNNFENVFDAQGNWVDAVNNPTRGIRPGDVFMGIINAQNTTLEGVPQWGMTLGTEQLSGIFAQQVTNIVIEGAQVHLDFAPTSITTFTKGTEVINIAPYLAAGEMMALYHDTGATNYESNGTMSDDIAKAVDGTKWASFGLAAVEGMGPGYFYSHIDPFSTPAVDFEGDGYAGLNFIVNNTGFNAFNGLNDPNEFEKGGVSLLTQLYFTNEIKYNPNYGPSTTASPWIFESNDPAHVAPVPEPSTVILLGAGILGLAAFGRKKRS